MLRCHSLQALQEIDQGAAHAFAFDVMKGCTKSEALGSRQESSQVHPRGNTLTIPRRVAIEEIGYGTLNIAASFSTVLTLTRLMPLSYF